MTIQLADKLYRESGLITTIENGMFADFEKENDRNSGNC